MGRFEQHSREWLAHALARHDLRPTRPYLASVEQDWSLMNKTRSLAVVALLACSAITPLALAQSTPAAQAARQQQLQAAQAAARARAAAAAAAPATPAPHGPPT